MKHGLAATAALLCVALAALSCVADTSLATTPVVVPTVPRPAVAVPAAAPAPPPRPVAPAAGTYFGLLHSVDVPGQSITFSVICLGADRKVMRELGVADKAPRIIPLLPSTQFSVFTSPPNNPAAGRETPVDLPVLAGFFGNNPGSKWFFMADPAGVTTLEQDSGVRPLPLPDDPCPHG